MGLLERVAAAPISWGICEVPGWGLELPRERVLGEMRELGFRATELGSEGYLPTDPVELRAVLDRFGLRLVGGFVGLVLHDRAEADATLAEARRAATVLSSAGADMFVTAVLTDWDWGPRRPMTEAQWEHAYEMLARIDGVLAEFGLRQTVHPHVGTLVERAVEVARLVRDTTARFCLDTGHFAIGGVDLLEFASTTGDRVDHVHLKDVDLATARRVTAGELTLMQGVQAGMFTPLGAGDVPIGALIRSLEESAYDGWYVLEQDTAITGWLPDEGKGPIEDVQACLDHLRGIAADLGNAA